MQQSVLFYRTRRSIWYAYILEHTQEENIMVGNANDVLDKIFESNKDKQFISFPAESGHTTKLPLCCLSVDSSPDLVDLHPKSKLGIGSYDINCDEDFLILELSHHNGSGATYLIQNTALARKYGIAKTEVWLCNVVHTVLGEHPKVMTVVPTRYELKNWYII